MKKILAVISVLSILTLTGCSFNSEQSNMTDDTSAILEYISGSEDTAGDAGESLDNAADKIDVNSENTVSGEVSDTHIPIDFTKISFQFVNTTDDNKSVLKCVIKNDTDYDICKMNVRFSVNRNLSDAELLALDGLSNWDRDYSVLSLVSKYEHYLPSCDSDMASVIFITDRRVLPDKPTEEQAECMVVNVADIVYIDNGLYYTTHCDYTTSSIVEETETENAMKWGTTELAELVPLPSAAKGTMVQADEDNWFFAYVFGVNHDEFDKYVSDVTALGKYDDTWYTDRTAVFYGSDIYITVSHDDSDPIMYVTARRRNIGS